MKEKYLMSIHLLGARKRLAECAAKRVRLGRHVILASDVRRTVMEGSMIERLGRRIFI